MPRLTYSVDDTLNLQPGHALCLVRSFAGTMQGASRREAVHCWLRNILANVLHISEETITFARTDTGKPWLPSHQDFHFNLSHSGSLAAVALSGERPVGVDIERVAGSPDMKQRIATRFFHSDECSWLTLHNEDYLLHFTTLWSLKEAWLKMTGAGLMQPLSSFHIDLSEEGKAVVFSSEGQQIGSVYYQTIAGDDRFCLSYAIETDDMNPPVIWRVIYQKNDSR